MSATPVNSPVGKGSQHPFKDYIDVDIRSQQGEGYGPECCCAVAGSVGAGSQANES